MAKPKTKYVCQECGYTVVKWLGRCPECGNYSTFAEETEVKVTGAHPQSYTSSKPLRLKEIQPIPEARVSTGSAELDRVLGGGFVQGSLTLVGGDPGIGKSTLLLQVCRQLGHQKKTILYVSGEESVQQIKLRAERIGVTTENLKLLSETNMAVIEKILLEETPNYCIIDSIQTMYIDEISSAPGSVSQVREVTSKLMHIGKGKNISIVIVGHVTKDGAIAGPRILEHMVDTVLYFEGDKRASYRIVRAVKNRFGANELGVFEMTDRGLKEILNPSEYMLSGKPQNVSGSVVTCCIEGTTPLMLEVQSLISYTSFNMPRRMATGIDFNRVILLIAVLEKRAGLQLANYDSYVNLTGGIKITEPALDCAVIAAVISSFKDKCIPEGTVVFGEIGLTGEVRAISLAGKRVAEAAKLGFKRCILPKSNLREATMAVKNKDIEITGVENISQLIDVLF
ncbi:MAG: DNA repair protein RadA [Firmicutes bacterium]|nr:DNA repair protein RadA [Bacillota bacterium]